MLGLDAASHPPFRSDRMLIVYNPAAGRRRTSRLWRVLDLLAASGVHFELAESGYPGHAASLAAAAARAGERLVVAAGGDGTIADIANGLRGGGCRLGVIPLGTANVLAHELGLPFAPVAVAAALAFGKSRTVWPGLFSAAGVASPKLFVQMVGVGFDARVVHALWPPMKRALGRAAYVVQGVREVARYRFGPVAVTLDGGAACEVASVIVSKGHFYGGCHVLAPGASPTERGFTVALFDRGGPHWALLYGAALPMGRLRHMPGLRLVRAERVSITAENIPAQADGDPAGCAPVTVCDAERSIEVIVG